MRQYLVYLAGPITGCTFEGCVNWREWFIDRLPKEIIGLSPMRGKTYLEHEQDIKNDYASMALSSSRGIITRDYNDCKRADLLVVNMLGATRVSIGTVMEIAWAKAFSVPVILVMEREGNIHEHSMLTESVGYRVETLEEALLLTKVVLLPAPHRKPVPPPPVNDKGLMEAAKAIYEQAHAQVMSDPEIQKTRDSIEESLAKCREWRMTDEEAEELMK